MPRNPKKRQKRSRKQVKTSKLNIAKANQHRCCEIHNGTSMQIVVDEAYKWRKEADRQRKVIADEKRRRLNEQRKSIRMKKSGQLRKEQLMKSKKEAYHLRSQLELLQHNIQKAEKYTGEIMDQLRHEVFQWKSRVKIANQHRTKIQKRLQRLECAKENLKKRLISNLKTRPATFYMQKKGRYTPQARALARLMVTAGAAESKVGRALQDIGAALGVEVTKAVSKRSVQRFILERGVAADIQLVYEILKSSKITLSTDSTSHKHIEYECRTIVLQVVDYSNPDALPEWKSRALGVDTSVNHTSQTQINGLKRLLVDLADIFNRSPLAKREGLRFNPEDFGYHLIGTTGDHAADQKKSHEILKTWRKDIILQRLGEEALFEMDVSRVLATLMSLKAKQIEELGGQAAWDALDDDAKAGADISIIRQVGQQVFDSLPPSEQKRLTRFIRTGCCMHKDLNCVKAGVKRLEGLWGSLGLVPPILLANKDNAATLAHRIDVSNPTAAEKRAEELSKHGATHATELGGMLFRNKIKKIGQQDTYDWYMEVEVGYRVPYPDVNNTRYGTHGEAAATIIVYHKYFVNFMDFIRDSKDRPGHTNIEKNFANALKDNPTLTELCVLALYNIFISRPFMRYVRKHNNLLDLRPLFEKKVQLLERIHQQPEIWIKQEISYEDATLDSVECEAWESKVHAAIYSLSPELPALCKGISFFAEGARDAFVERFSNEFKEGGDIDSLTETEIRELYFSSTNDANEGGLGSWRRAQERRPRETLHKFNASYKARRNNMEDFIRYKLAEEDDVLYNIRTARRRDEEKLQGKLKTAQMVADQAKIVENRKKEAKRDERHDQKTTILMETAGRMVLCEAAVNGLTNEELNRQLDYHRELEKHIPTSESSSPSLAPSSAPTLPESAKKLTVPKKSYMKTKEHRVVELKKAIGRYIVRGEEANHQYHTQAFSSLNVQANQANIDGDNIYYYANDIL